MLMPKLILTLKTQHKAGNLQNETSGSSYLPNDERCMGYQVHIQLVLDKATETQIQRHLLRSTVLRCAKSKETSRYLSTEELCLRRLNRSGKLVESRLRVYFLLVIFFLVCGCGGLKLHTTLGALEMVAFLI